jgi:hypothetical protein
VTALLFTIGKFLIGLYLGKSDVTSSFGAAGSLVIMMVWVYYSAQIFLFGAEFTWVYANKYGSRRNEGQQQKAARTEESDVPTRSDTDKTTGATPSAGPPAAPTAPYGAAPFVDQERGGHAAAATAPAPVVLTAAPVASRVTRHHGPAAFLRDNRIAVGLAVTTAVIVGIVARLGAVKRSMRRAMRPVRSAVHRRLAS